jgi:hypothetical protein
MLLDKFFFWGLAVVGMGVGTYIIYTGWASVENPPACLPEHRFVIHRYINPILVLSGILI